MLAQPHYTRMSIEDYLTLDRSSRDTCYEYIDGYAYMLAGGTRYHSIIGGNMIKEAKPKLISSISGTGTWISSNTTNHHL